VVSVRLELCLYAVAGVSVLQYLQNVSPSLALGAELVYQYGPTVPGRQIAIYTLAGRWTGLFSLSFVFSTLACTPYPAFIGWGCRV